MRNFKNSSAFWASIGLAILVTAYDLVPLRHALREWNDFAFVFAAGRVWLEGGSPYDVPLWQSQWADITPSFVGLEPGQGVAPTQPYLYPPHWVLLAVPLAALPWALAVRIWDLVNVLSYVSMIAVSCALLSPHLLNPRKHPLFWLAVTGASLNAAVRWTLWECQLSMISTAAVMGAYWALSEKRWGMLTLCTFVALLKPQIGILPLYYLALIGGLRFVAIGGGLTVAVGALALSHVDWSLLPGQYQNCVRLHLSIGYNNPDEFYSLSSLLVGIVPHEKLSALIAFALLSIVALDRYRRPPLGFKAPAFALRDLALACTLTTAFIPLHGYDLVLLTPVFFWAMTLSERWLTVAICGLAVIPSRLGGVGHTWGVFPLAPYATVALAALCLLAWKRQADRNSSPATVG
jgi:hypothetical protein